MLDYAVRDYEGFRTAMIAKLQELLPSYTDTSSSDAGIVIIETMAYMLDLISYYLDVVSGEVFLETAQERASVIKLTSVLGYSLQGNSPAKFYQVFEITPQALDYTIPAGTRVKTPETDSEPSEFYELDADVVIAAGDTGIEKPAATYTYQSLVTHGYTVTQDILGSSNASANQKFRMNYYPLAVDATNDDYFILLIDEGTGFIKWNRVDSFIDSISTDKDYILSTDENDISSITLGDGTNGKIPLLYNEGITATYRVGGGVIGNVANEAISELEVPLPEVLSTFNFGTADTLGIDKETVEQAKIHALALARAMWRAVTLTDYEDLAISELSSRKASAIFNTANYITTDGTIVLKKDEIVLNTPVSSGGGTVGHYYKAVTALGSTALATEDYSVTADWTDVTNYVCVYLLPELTTELATADETAAETLYTERQVMGTYYNVNSPVYLEQDITITAKTTSDYVNADLEVLLETLAADLLAVGMYDFGADLNASNLVVALSEVEGIYSITVTDPASDVEVDENTIIIAGTIGATVTGGT